MFAAADSLGLTWLARVAAAVPYAFSPVAPTRRLGDADGLRSILEDCERREDAWGAALVLAMRCLGALRHGQCDTSALEDLALRFRKLDAPVLEAWARAAFALGAVTEDLPDALVEAQAAEALARTAGVPGALAIAYAAIALARADQREEMLELAASTAATVGLSCRPWEFVQADPAPPATRCLPGRAAPARPACPSTCGASAASTCASVTFPSTSARCGRGRVRHCACWPCRPAAPYTGSCCSMHCGGTWTPSRQCTTCTSPCRAFAPCSNARHPRAGAGFCGGTASRTSSRSRRARRSTSSRSRPRSRRPTGLGSGARRTWPAPPCVGHSTCTSATYCPRAGRPNGSRPREHYRMRAAEAAGTLATLELEAGDPAAAVIASQRSISIDEFRDASWRTLLRAYAAAGDVAAAEQARRSYADVLASLGVPEQVIRA